MRRTFAFTIAAIVSLVLFSGCAKMAKMAPLSMQKTVTGPLANLAFSTDPGQMSGVSRSSLKLGTGETAIIYVRGLDDKGHWIKLPDNAVVTWKADKEVEVTPAAGTTVTIKVLSPISTSAYVTATTTSESGAKIETLMQVSN